MIGVSYEMSYDDVKGLCRWVGHLEITNCDLKMRSIASIMSRIRSSGSLTARRFPNDAIANSAPNTALGHDIHMPADRFVELHDENAEVEQAAPCIEVHQQIDVALVGRLSSGD